MSQFVEKAVAFEEKSKWKNAAETYLKAANEFIVSGKPESAKEPLLKAIENAEKEDLPSLLVEIIFVFNCITSDEEKKKILLKAIKPLDQLIKDADNKKRYDVLLELVDKKISASKVIQKDIEEAQIEKAMYLQQIALLIITSNKIEERKLGKTYLKEAAETLQEIGKLEEKVQGEIDAFTLLLNEGFLEEGLLVFDGLIEYCKANGLTEKATNAIKIIIALAQEILIGKGSKKLIKEVKEKLNQDDPGGELLELGIEKGRDIGLNETIAEIAQILSEHAKLLFEKKKYNPALEVYSKALKLLVEIQQRDSALKLADDITKNAYALLDIKGMFAVGLSYFESIHQIEKIDLEYLGAFYQIKAQNMFSKGRMEIALEDYKNSTKAYLFGKLAEKFTAIVDEIFNKAVELITIKKIELAVRYTESGNEILEGVKAFNQLGTNLTKISVELSKANQIKEAENFSIKAVENLIKAGEIIGAAHSHKAFGESLLGLEHYDSAIFRMIEAAKLYKSAKSDKEILGAITPLVIAAKNKLNEKNVELAQQLFNGATQCAQQKDPITETNIVIEFADHAIFNGFPEIALEYLAYATRVLGKNHPDENKDLAKKLLEIGKRLIISNQNYALGKSFIEYGINTLVLLSESLDATNSLLEYSQLLFDNNQNVLAKDLLVLITKIISSESNSDIFAQKVSFGAKILIDYNFIQEGIELLRKAVGSYLSLGSNEPVIQIAFYCADKAKRAIENNEVIQAKHLYITAMEFSSLINLETQDQILQDATTLFLDLGDLYAVREFYDFARNNLEGEKDYLTKLGRLIIYQGGILRDQKEMFEESSDFIRNGITILNQVGMLSEAGEAALAQGQLFIEKGNFIFGEELIETGAQIFIQTSDPERSGDAFQALADVNIRRESWADALRQIQLANKSYQHANLLEKLAIAIIKTADIGSKSLISNPEGNRNFALSCFEIALTIAQESQLIDAIIDIYLFEARAFALIKDHQTTSNLFLQAVNLLEQQDETIKSPSIAEELSIYANSFILEGEIELGLHIVDLSTGIFLRLSQPIKASEVYMKSCNSLLKQNRIVEGVKLVLLASDTLMVANEFEQAAKILEEIADLLFEMKDYQNASIVTGQIVTVHQKTRNIEEQKKAIYKLVGKVQEVIADGKIMEGEQLWEQVANYSISTNLEYALEINGMRIDSLRVAGMYNSMNNAFTQMLPILEENFEQMLDQGNKIANIAAELYDKDELELSKSFIQTAIEYYRKSENHEHAKNLCLSMSHRFISKGDEVNGIELIDHAARIANEIEGSHEAAKIYLISGFILVETGHQKSGKLAIDKAIDIELQTKNMTGCNELGELTLAKATELAQSDLEKASDIYALAVTIFEKAGAYTKAGETSSIIVGNHLSVGNAIEAVESAQKAVELYIKDKNVEHAVGTTKQILESARRFLEENELTKAVHILEKGRLLVEKISRFDLLSIIVSIYLAAANQFLPNRKSSIGVFFLNRALDLASSSPDPEEIKRIIDMSLKLAIEIISKKNSIAGAKVLEIVTNQDISKKALLPYVSEIYLEGTKITLDVEWNMIGKITRDALQFFKANKQDENINHLISILTKRANADIMLNKPQLGFFFLDFAIRLARDAEDPRLLALIGSESFEQLLILDQESDLDIRYKLLGYCYQLFQEVQNMDAVEQVGKEFIKLGSRDLINNMQSVRGYDAILTSRDIAVQTQNDTLMTTVVLAMLDFGKQLSVNNPRTTLTTLEDIIEGLEAFEVPHSNRAELDYKVLSDYLKTIMAFGEKVSKTEDDYSLGKKIIELSMRIIVLTKNQAIIERELIDTQKDFQKLYRRANEDAAFRLRHTALLMIDLRNSDVANEIAENSFKTAQAQFEKKRYEDSISFLDSSLKLNEKLSMATELKNIGLFALSAGDRLVTEGKIEDSMTYYDIAVEAFDKANDDESSNRLVNRIFQTREWDADVNIAYKCYKIASDSAVRVRNFQKAHEIANKCFNRGIAFIDQPRIPVNLSTKFITLAGKIFEDIGANKDAANAYDNAILKFLRLLKTRKNVETVVIELLTKTAVNRMAGCDMDSLETIFIRIMELAELKKSKYIKTIARTLKLINSSKVGAAWDLIASLPFISHGRLRKIMSSTKNRIIYDLSQKGTFDRTLFSSTDRSLPLSDYLLESLIIARKIEGQPINKDVFISLNKIQAIRSYFYSEYQLWGRIELDAITKEFSIQHNDAVSIVRREFLSSLYMGILDNEQKTFYSSDRLKAEISLILNRERKKAAIFDPMQVANEMRIPPDIIKEVLREISCEEVVESAIGS
jgi:tetratricopeptide (TPR) repeat protein